MPKEKSYKKLPDRKPVVSGRFYPSTEAELRSELAQLFLQASKLVSERKLQYEEIRAIVSPHAGYIFSGIVAASAYLNIQNRKAFNRIFLIGSSHHAWFEGASVYYEGHYVTPLGKIEIDRKIATGLIQSNEKFQYRPEAHTNEHALEVQLPFLQYAIGKAFKIVPIIIGGQSKDTPRNLAETLKPYFIPENLFIISTDLSHYPEYYDAVKIDKLTTESICTNNPEKFVEQLKENDQKNIQNLATSICGWTSVLTLLHITHSLPDIHYVPVLYQNSGDIALYGEKSRVVGYQSIVVTSENKSSEQAFKLNNEEKKLLLSIARDSITNNLNSVRSIPFDEDELPRAFREHCGAFVSIYVDDKLRGCIGRIENDEALFTTIQKMAVASSTRDYRFSPISRSEISRMHIEISLLTPLRKIESIHEIVPKKHGILIRKDSRSGTFLPQVAEKTGWDTEELLAQCSERKAGLGRNGWKDADIFIYEAVVFSDKS
jgi:AmmeMemoRadiSam system protein B/AmmeMemoRadiSam system protein A